MTWGSPSGEQQDLVSILDMAVIQRIREMEVRGQPSILEEVVGLYLELAPQLLASARSGLANNDSKSIFSAAHQLKSMSAQLGTMQAAETARQVEYLGREGELTGMKELLDRLEESLSLSYEALRTVR